MRRREFIAVLGAASLPPVAARAQRLGVFLVGFLHSALPGPFARLVADFRAGLREVGFVEGRNVAIEFRWAEGHEDRLPGLAADLIRRGVAVIATPASTAAALAAKSATGTVPIVFATGADPVALGLVKSFNRPGGNATGIAFETVELVGKLLEMLHQLVPQARRLAALVNPNYPLTPDIAKSLEAGASALGLTVEILRAGSPAEIDAAVGGLAPGSALLITPDFTARRAQLAALALRRGVAAIYDVREFPDDGGLASYGPSFPDIYRQTGIYTGRILKGEKPADLPVERPIKFELVINLKTAAALGLAVPWRLLALADDVIR